MYGIMLLEITSNHIKYSVNIPTVIRINYTITQIMYRLQPGSLPFYLLCLVFL